MKGLQTQVRDLARSLKLFVTLAVIGVIHIHSSRRGLDAVSDRSDIVEGCTGADRSSLL